MCRTHTRSIPWLALLWLVAALGAPRAAAGGTTVLGPGCDLAKLGASDDQAFLAFDRNLREALEKRDAVAITALIAYPVRIGDPDGSSQALENPLAVQRRFAGIFPEEVRAAVLGTQPSAVFCKDEGVMYGHGEVWIAARGEKEGQVYGVKSINLPAAKGAAAATQAPRVDFACQTRKHAIIIDTQDGEHFTYRAWNRPHPLQGKPDMEIKSGSYATEGTGVCRSEVWSFATGEIRFVLDGLSPCAEDSPPPGARAELRLYRTGQEEAKQSWWCF